MIMRCEPSTTAYGINTVIAINLFFSTTTTTTTIITTSTTITITTMVTTINSESINTFYLYVYKRQRYAKTILFSNLISMIMRSC